MEIENFSLVFQQISYHFKVKAMVNLRLRWWKVAMGPPNIQARVLQVVVAMGTEWKPGC